MFTKEKKEIVLAIIASVLPWIFPTFFLWAQNVKEAGIKEIIIPEIIFIICALVMLAVGMVIWRNIKTAAVFSVVGGLFFVNFGMICEFVHEKIPAIRYRYLLLIAIAVIVTITFFVHKFSTIAEDLLKIIVIVFSMLIAFNYITAFPTVVKKINSGKIVTEDYLQDTESYTGKSNIYYLLCDEYASFAQLKEEFDFSNNEFKNKMIDLGFNISENSFNDDCSTSIVMANLMQLEYLATADSTSVELENLTKNGKVQNILKQRGYTLRGIGDTAWLGFNSDLAVNESARTAEGENLTFLALKNSFIGKFMESRVDLENMKNMTLIKDSFEALEELEIKPDSNVFTMFYVCAPHHPYYFKEDGSVNKEEYWTNYDGNNDESYVGMIKYINERLIKAVSKIVREDPNSIIIICSDHGNRFGISNADKTTQILNLLYYKNEILNDFEGLSGLNTLIYIFNREFDLNMDYVDLPLKK